MIKFKRVGAVEMSPDGRMVAYTISTPLMEGEKSEFLTHIWMASTDGKTNVQLPQGDKSCMNPSFSPTEITLPSHRNRNGEGKTQVWVMRVNGGERTPIKIKVRLEQLPGVPTTSAWPIRSAMVIRSGGEMQKEKKELDYRRRVEIRAPLHIALEKRQPLSVARASEKFKRLTKGNFHITSFDWSPDSKSIAFTHQRTTSADNGRHRISPLSLPTVAR